MISIQQEPGRNILYTTATDTLDQQNYDRFLPVAEGIIEKHGNDFEKVAMVGRSGLDCSIQNVFTFLIISL